MTDKTKAKRVITVYRYSESTLRRKRKRSAKMKKASEELLRFVKEHYSEKELASYYPFTEESLFDLSEDIAENVEYPLVNQQEDGKKIDENLLDLVTKIGDELREGNLDCKDLTERLRLSFESSKPKKE